MKNLKNYLSEYHPAEEVEVIDSFNDSHYMTAAEAIAAYGDELVEWEADDTKTWKLAKKRGGGSRVGEIKRLAYEMERAKLDFNFWDTLEVDPDSKLRGPAEFQQAEKEKWCIHMREKHKKYRQMLALKVLEAVMAGSTGEQVREAILVGRERAIDEMED